MPRKPPLRYLYVPEPMIDRLLRIACSSREYLDWVQSKDGKDPEEVRRLFKNLKSALGSASELDTLIRELREVLEDNAHA
jgi:hypothetical protein